MIENWKKAYKFFSVQLLAVLIVLAGLEPFVPQISALLPEHWVPVFAALILFSRLVSQSKKPTDPNVLIEAAARAGATLKKGSALIVLLVCSGCVEPETAAKRQACLITAEGNSALKAERECIQADLGWYDCPHRERIMSELAGAQEKCR
jgi:hypothetical protein